MIRIAEQSDIQKMLELGRAMHAESRYNALPWDNDKVAGLISWLIEEPDGCAFVAENDEGETVGGFIGVICPHFCSQALVAQDYALFVSKDKRGAFIGVQLLNAFTAWAQVRGAAMIMVGVTTGIKHDSTERLFNSVGYQEIGQIYDWSAA